MWKPTYAEGGGGDRRWPWPWSGSGRRGGVGFLLLGFLRVWVCVLVDSVGVLGCGGCSTIWPGKNGHLWGVDVERCKGGGWETMLGLSLVGVSNSRSTRGRGLLGEEHWPGCVAICVHVGGDEEGRKIGGGRSLVESSGRWSRLVLCRAMEKGGWWLLERQGHRCCPFSGPSRARCLARGLVSVPRRGDAGVPVSWCFLAFNVIIGARMDVDLSCR